MTERTTAELPAGVLEQVWTPGGVRLRRLTTGEHWNWLFVPGGPGLGSESLLDLAHGLSLQGASWLVDLPGDGSNRDHPNIAPDAYTDWPGVLAEAAAALPNVIMVGHSTGAMMILAVPELEAHLAALVLISGAPDASWKDRFASFAQEHPIPEVTSAAAKFAEHPSDQTMRDLTVAAAPWNFCTDSLADGERLLAGLPYNCAATAWADENFDDTYAARWVPQVIPTMILGGSEDKVVAQDLWESAHSFNRSNVSRRVVSGAAHFPWIDEPDAVAAAFAEFGSRLGASPEN